MEVESFENGYEKIEWRGFWQRWEAEKKIFWMESVTLILL
jgi:hypothetical protein